MVTASAVMLITAFGTLVVTISDARARAECIAANSIQESVASGALPFLADGDAVMLALGITLLCGVPTFVAWYVFYRLRGLGK